MLLCEGKKTWEFRKFPGKVEKVYWVHLLSFERKWSPTDLIVELPACLGEVGKKWRTWGPEAAMGLVGLSRFASSTPALLWADHLECCWGDRSNINAIKPHIWVPKSLTLKFTLIGLLPEMLSSCSYLIFTKSHPRSCPRRCGFKEMTWFLQVFDFTSKTLEVLYIITQSLLLINNKESQLLHQCLFLKNMQIINLVSVKECLFALQSLWIHSTSVETKKSSHLRSFLFD